MEMPGSYPVLVSVTPRSCKSEGVSSDCDSSPTRSVDATPRFDISTPKFNVDKPMQLLTSASTPLVPRLALKKATAQAVVPGLTGSQTSRIHNKTHNGLQPAKGSWRVKEAEKIVGAVEVPEPRNGDALHEVSSSSALRTRSRSGQLFEELMALRSKCEQLSRQNAFLIQDLDERVAEGEQLFTSLRRRNAEVEDLSRKYRAALNASKHATEELSEAHQKDLKRQQELQMMTGKIESVSRELLESRLALVTYVDSVAQTQANLRSENQVLTTQNQKLLQEVAMLRETRCNVEHMAMDDRSATTCNIMPTLLGRVALLSASPFRKNPSECSWLQRRSFMSEETVTPPPEQCTRSFYTEAELEVSEGLVSNSQAEAEDGSDVSGNAWLVLVCVCVCVLNLKR